MRQLVRAARRVRAGHAVPMDAVLHALDDAAALLRTRPLVEFVTGGCTMVFGATRGHACDLAHYILSHLLSHTTVRHVVLLGNYIDGAHHSVEVLYLIAMLVVHGEAARRLRVVPLLGRHELLYPMSTDGGFGSLQSELQLRALHTNKAAMGMYEATVRRFFAALRVACVVNGRFFCVAGGLSSRHRYIADVVNDAATCSAAAAAAAATTAATACGGGGAAPPPPPMPPLSSALRELVLNEPMDEDEERMAGGSAFVAGQHDSPFRFTFNAACNFVTRNRLAMLVVGMEYHTSRPDYDSFARSNHYKESIYFPGYTLGHIHPDTHLAAVLTLFSAPCFCGVNRNRACVAMLDDDLLALRELAMYARRPLITPGKQDHAFAWAQPALERACVAMARDIVLGALTADTCSGDDKGSDVDGHDSEDATAALLPPHASQSASLRQRHDTTATMRAQAAVRCAATTSTRARAEVVSRQLVLSSRADDAHDAADKMRTLCRLLARHHMPLPSVPQTPAVAIVRSDEQYA